MLNSSYYNNNNNSYLNLWSVSSDIMLRMGYSLDEIQDALIKQKYNDVMATYLLLDYRNSEVCYSKDHVNICVFQVEQ